MTGPRLSLSAAVLIGLALIPTLLHSYVDVRSTDGYTATAINEQLAGFSSRRSDRPAEWVKKTFDSVDWSERNFHKPEGGEITLFVSRSYDLKRLYHHPEHAIAYGYDLRQAGTERLAGIPQASVHVLRGNEDKNQGLALYALLYDGGFVDNPYMFQLRTAGELLVRPRRPMTLFFAHDRTAAADASLEGAPVTRVLAAAIRSFQSQGK